MDTHTRQSTMRRGTNSSVFDQGFYRNTAPSDQNAKRTTRFPRWVEPGQPHWRLKVALELIQTGHFYDGNDLWVEKIRRYLTEFLKGTISPTGIHRFWRAANTLYSARSPQTHRLEALLLTKESDGTIAQVLHLNPRLVRAYRKMFFDVDVLPPVLLRGRYSCLGRPLDQYERWEQGAIEGGLAMLQGIWQYEATDPPPPADVESRPDRLNAAGMLRQGSQCFRQYPPKCQ